jgi:hypothetical protein
MDGYGIDLLMAALLALTVVWCVRVDRRLRGLRAGHAELATFLAALEAACARAEAVAGELREAAAAAEPRLSGTPGAPAAPSSGAGPRGPFLGRPGAAARSPLVASPRRQDEERRSQEAAATLLAALESLR